MSLRFALNLLHYCPQKAFATKAQRFWVLAQDCAALFFEPYISGLTVSCSSCFTGP